jgi:hypothetical protein
LEAAGQVEAVAEGLEGRGCSTQLGSTICSCLVHSSIENQCGAPHKELAI